MWHGHRGHASPQDIEEESEDEAFHEANERVNVLWFSPLDSCAAVQRTSTMRPLPCDCTEVLTVTPTEMASTNCLGPASAPYPHMYYHVPPERNSTPENDIVIQPNRQNNDDDHSDAESDRTLTGDDASSVSTLTLSPDKRTPKLLKRSKSLLAPIDHRNMNETTLDRRRRRGGRNMAAATNLNTQVANRVIKYARSVRNVYERDLGCLSCGLLPLCPVTGQCGHTRCADCVAVSLKCPCGYESPNVSVNILIRDLLKQTIFEAQSSRSSRTMPPALASVNMNTDDINVASTSKQPTIKPQPMSGAGRSSRGHIRVAGAAAMARIPMSDRARYNHALDLLRVGAHLDAVPYLAFAAASGKPALRKARELLTLTIHVLSGNRDPRFLTAQLIRSVRRLSPISWIRTTDMECILCCDTFTNPVTTPCGHMFCRTCLEKTLDYGKRCPLCLQDLRGFSLAGTVNTLFVQAALKSVNINVTPPPLEPDSIHIFKCTVAFPTVPCPLFIFDPRYWLMIRRVLESGSRRFGMVACDRGQDYADYGTILEVRDCVLLEDGRSILSTIGLTRFKVIERGVRDGCDVARIFPIYDMTPRGEFETCYIKAVAQRIMFKGLLWLSRLNLKVRADVEAAFGSLQPDGFFEENWWESADGPSWLWWLIAVLPLRTEIKVLILATNSLHKRLMAVARVLEAVDHDRPNMFHSQYRLHSPIHATDDQAMEHDNVIEN